MVTDTTPDAKETQKPTDTSKESLTPKGIQALQGVDADTQARLDEWQRTHDPANWNYELGSPHADFQASKDIAATQRQHEIGQKAAGINMGADPSPLSVIQSVTEAALVTREAHKESQGKDETPMDQHMLEKYGPAPYTDPAYPKEKEPEA